MSTKKILISYPIFLPVCPRDINQNAWNNTWSHRLFWCRKVLFRYKPIDLYRINANEKCQCVSIRDNKFDTFKALNTSINTTLTYLPNLLAPYIL